MKKRSLNSIIPFIDSIVSNSLNEQRIKNMLTEEMNYDTKNDITPEADIIMAAWIDAMISGLSKSKDKLKSDFIIDYILEILRYYENLESSKKIENFEKNFNDLMNNPLFISTMNDSNFVNMLLSIKDAHTKRILESLKDENNYEEFKKNVIKIIPGFKFVDKDMFGF